MATIDWQTVTGPSNKNKSVLESVAKLIENVEASQDLRAIPDVKKLKAKGNYYRIRHIVRGQRNLNRAVSVLTSIIISRR